MPPGDFNQFIKNLDDALKHLYKPKAEFLNCGDITTDYLVEGNLKKQLASYEQHTICCTQLILKHEFKITEGLPSTIYLQITVE
jgi:hypothetical protein